MSALSPIIRAVVRQPIEREATRIEPLAVLPVFFRLSNQTAVVAGGSDAAAWKAELLLAAGARLQLFAPSQTVGEQFTRLLARDQGDGRIAHHDRGWTPDGFAGAAIAIADAQTETEARAFYAAAKAAGVPVNIIDKPDYCDFQFGTIVNRSPVVVGISTDGAAPILAQAIRRKIETLLPASLAAWAEMARKLRATFHARLEPGLHRRAFWERFVDHAFGPTPGPAAEQALLDECDRITRAGGKATGRVMLVGAGPGDAELLTLKAVRSLQAADVILFDDLVSDSVLELARREAKRILVGKRGGRPSCKQDDINDMMVKLARAGKHVVRLKSGDPMIFGRAGEEIDRLDAEGIPVDVVPGITAGLAMAATLGLSLTHRDCARSVRFITGHSRKGSVPDDIDWTAAADPSATTIFYMAGTTADQIAAKLRAHGLDGHTPVVIASALSRPDEEVWRGELDLLPAKLREKRHGSPVLIGIGAVFGRRAATLFNHDEGEDHHPLSRSAG
ncbi:siroheme synthase CysG [Chelatococcus asaccharovorans]|uniref:siroheme synthase CysG n=1 Tax=Chelatococcus asaccharovorans TaxID=28210 RepID=UPI00224C685C|nr:siroheme synthase CysG [Chelatococcus asaccharovorans]CAH1661768.1 Uroporphyrinogen-III C-methyltransferase / Precorrin-2 dehydrogenase / Sirohydrochlorin ferrochelatase [Chelatococcus asaccharovorans]CAH1689494.1 Uroporphyrinogen-III C-methyltransferase / Precorrin-2 dehydrogenase / Sirohydrochlorin ferrochelatase [Chelatococcus asaccharovorans]